MTITVAVGTFVVCAAFRHERLSIVIPYAVVASRVLTWPDWWALTLVFILFSLASRIEGALHD